MRPLSAASSAAPAASAKCDTGLGLARRSTHEAVANEEAGEALADGGEGPTARCADEPKATGREAEGGDRRGAASLGLRRA